MVVKDPEERMALDNIEEFLNDDGKIVSYKFLSLTLSIHVNKSKYLLEEYLKEKNKDEEKLEVVYFIGGIKQIGTEKVLKFTLVKSDSLEDIKEKFDTVTTCHIYSIQKSKLKSFDILYSCDCDLIKQSLHELHNYSEIQCNFTRRDSVVPVPQQPANNHVSNSNKETTKNLPKTNTLSTDNKFKGKETQAALFFGSKTGKKEEKMKENIKNELAKKPSKKEEKPSEIAGAFSKSKPLKKKNEEKKDEDETMEVDVETKEEPPEKVEKKKETKTQEKKSNSTKKRKVILEGSDDEDDFQNFLANTKKSKTENTKENVKKTSTKKIRIESDDEEEDIDVIAPTPEPVKKPKSKRRKTDSDKQSSPPNIAKEIEDSKDEEQSKSTINPVETIVEEKKSSPETTVKRRKRRKVMKSKQYFSEEDGFMVTQKVYESESYSEESGDDEEKKQATKKDEEKQRVAKELDAKVKSSNKKNKSQSSIGSFFKKQKK